MVPSGAWSGVGGRGRSAGFLAGREGAGAAGTGTGAGAVGGKRRAGGGSRADLRATGESGVGGSGRVASLSGPGSGAPPLPPATGVTGSNVSMESIDFCF